MKIGFFGGSFNPPTNAHINLAKKAKKECELDKIIFVPMGDFYKKKGLAKAKDRYNMLKLAIEEKDKEILEVSDMELAIKENLGAIEAFTNIEKLYPIDEKYFMMGADNFEKILTWKKSKKLIENYNYIIFERENIDLEKFIKEKINTKTTIKIIKNVNYKNMSSTEFRKNSNKELVPKEVLKYIEKNKIYQGE